MALGPDLNTSGYIAPVSLHQGERILDTRGRTGAHVCKFVMFPGPEAQLVVLAQQPGKGHPLTGTVFDAEQYRPNPKSKHPHKHVFASVGRPIEAQEAVTAISYLTQLAANEQPQGHPG